MSARPMAELLTGAVPEGFSATPFDGEAATLAFLAEARKRDAIARFEAAVPPAMRESDWGHAAMMPNRAQIERVLAHQVGARAGFIEQVFFGKGHQRALGRQAGPALLQLEQRMQPQLALLLLHLVQHLIHHLLTESQSHLQLELLGLFQKGF